MWYIPYWYVTPHHSYIYPLFVCVCAKSLIHMRYISYSNVTPHSYTYPLSNCVCGISLIHTRDMTHSYVWHDVWHVSFVCVTWPIYLWHDSFLTQSYAPLCVHTQWPIVFAEMQGSFVEKYRALLQRYRALLEGNRALLEVNRQICTEMLIRVHTQWPIVAWCWTCT